MLQPRSIPDPHSTNAATVEAMYCSESTMISPGQTVAEARRFLKHILNVPVEAVARVNGRRVPDPYLLKDGDTLEFIVDHGEKGGDCSSEAEMLANGATPEQLKEFRATHRRPRDWDESLPGIRYYRDCAVLPWLLSQVPQHPNAKQGRRAKQQRTMNVETANEAASKLAKRDKSFVDGSSRQWAEQIGCSEGLVRQTKLWKDTMKKTGRGRKDREAEPKAVSLTPGLEATIGSPDLELQRLIAEQEADARSEPSPFDEDVFVGRPQIVRHYKKL